MLFGCVWVVNGSSTYGAQGFVQGSVGAAIGGACAHPLDLIKVRLQLQAEGAKLNMLQRLSFTWFPQPIAHKIRQK